MGAEKNIIAIELGSSSIRGIVGQRKADGTLHVLGYERENTPDCVRKGVIYNIDKTVQAIANILKRFEERHKFFVNSVYVGISGQSLHTVKNCVTRQLDARMAISEEVVDNLMDINLAQTYDESEILDVAPQEFRVGSRLTNDPVGVIADRIEGYYENVVARTVLRENINRCMQALNKEVAHFFISPLLLSNYLLTDTEKRSGCALVDFGAETTTVAVFEKNILRHLVVIPLGGNNITMDIAASQHIEIEEAEQLKRMYGSAYTDEAELQAPRQINISNDRVVDEKTLLNIIEARQQEIIMNVKQQIVAYSDRLLSGVVLTGGAANIRNIEAAFAYYTEFDKQLKVRHMPATTEFTTTLKLDPQANNIATLVAMLRRGEEECTSEMPSEPELDFEGRQHSATTPPTKGTVNGEGVVNKPEQNAPEQQPDDVPEAVADDQPDDQPREHKPSALKKFGKWIKHVAQTVVEEN